MRQDRLRYFAGIAVFAMLLIFSLSRLRVSAEGFDLSALAAPEISAKGAVVYNGATGEVLYENDSRVRLPMASTTKIMTSLIVLEQAEKGVDLDEKFTVDSEAVMTEGSSMGLKAGDIVSLRDLVCGMLLPSGNDAANAAAVRISGSIDAFVELMNRRAIELGLYSTHFVTPSGLDDYTDEHFSTAADMARLAAEAMKNEDFRAICSQQRIKLNFGDPPYDRWLTNTNKLLKIEGVTGIKTGFTDKARRCLVSSCMRDGCELICVTLNDPDDWADHMALYDYAFARVSEQKVSPKNVHVGVVGAESDGPECFECEVGELKATLKNGAAAQVRAEYHLPQFVYAPVAKGEVIGQVRYFLGDKEIARKPITAAEDVKAAQSRRGAGAVIDKVRLRLLEVVFGYSE